MLILLIFISLIFILFISNVMGRLVIETLGWKLKFNIPIGYFVLLCLAQILLLPLVEVGVNSTVYQFSYVFLVIWTILVLFLYNRKKIKIKELCFIMNETNKRSIFIITSIVILLICFIYIFIMADYRIDRMSDSAFYIPMIQENIITDKIYSVNPWSGVMENYSSLYRYVSYELLHASFLRILPINPVVYINHVMVILNILMVILTSFELVMGLFKKRYLQILTIISYIAIVFCFVTGIEDGYFFFFSTDMIQRLPYTGKVLAYLALIPMFYLINKEIFSDTPKKGRLLFALLIINLTATALTATSVFVLGIFYVAITLIRLYKKDDYKLTLGYCLTTIPLILHVILIKFKILFIPATIVYIILFLIYLHGRYIKNIMLFIKYLMYILVVTIPILSILVNFLDLFSEFNSINFFNFIKRLIQTFTVETLIVWLLVIIGIIGVIKNKKINKNEKYLFGYAPLIIFVIFINPISSSFIGSFLTTNDVYQRLFYIIPVLPLIGYCLQYLLEKYIIDTQRNKFSLFIIVIILFNCWTPLIQSYEVLAYRLGNPNFNFKYMLESKSLDSTLFLNELEKPIRVAYYYKDNNWGAELRYVRSIAPNVILPYNVQIHRHETSNNIFTKETYQQYQLHLLMNESIWLYDPYIDINGNKTDINNYEFALKYLVENYDYLVISASNEAFGNLLEGFGAIKVYENERDAIYNLSELNYN